MSEVFYPKNSIWPNGMKEDSENYAIFYQLGTNKVEVSSIDWPKGKKFVSPFIYDENNHLVGFIDSASLISSDNATIYLPYELIDANFSSIEKGTLAAHAPNAVVKKAKWADGTIDVIPEANFKYKGCTTLDNVKTVDSNYKTTDIVDGVWSEPLWDLEQGGDENLHRGMFEGCSNLTTFTSDLPSLTNGFSMFMNCTNLTTFSSDSSGSPINLSSLTDSVCMFMKCTNLTSFSSDLSSLTDGSEMFYGCEKFTSFSSDLHILTDGDKMFYNCSNLTTFSSDLPSLTNGTYMFHKCSNLESFTSDLSSLTNGYYMFQSCNKLTSFNSDLSSLTNGGSMFENCSYLTSFTSDLSSLTNGSYMFYNCKLNTASVQNIADTINTYSGTIRIGIGNSEPNEEEKAAFNKMVSKGWTVYVNGSEYTPTSPAAITTLDENGEEITTPIPFWAKPVPSDEQHAQYVDSEGNYYNILGAQFIYGDNLETYGMFTCFDDAVANMRLTKIEK